MSNRYTINPVVKQSLSQSVGCQLPLHKGAFALTHFINKQAAQLPLRFCAAIYYFVW